MNEPALKTTGAVARGGPWRALVTWLPRAWAEIDADRDPQARFGYREGGALVVAALGLAIMYFGGSEMTFLDWVAPLLGYDDPLTARVQPLYEIAGLLHWVAFCVLGYLVVPAIWLAAHGERLRDYHLGWAGTGRHLVVYLSIFAVMAVGIVVASRSPSFQLMYPMYQQAGRSWFDLIVWELAYGLQFFALEFFFRGFMLHSLRRVLGYGAIFVMAVPYCMLHFQKPFLECVLSIFGGIIIGTMAMRWRSVWGGALLHWLIALTMDVSAMVHRGEFPPGPLGP